MDVKSGANKSNELRYRKKYSDFLIKAKEEPKEAIAHFKEKR